MTQDDLEYISQAQIQQEILADQKQNTGVIAVILPLLELILSLLAWGSYTALHESWWLWGGLLLLAIVFGYSWIRSVVSAIVVKRLVKQGEFHVETDYARYIEDDDPRVSEILSDVLFYILDLLFIPFFFTAAVGNGTRYIHFGGKRRFAASKHTRDHATDGDLFYLVVLNTRRGHIMRIYNAKDYRLEE
jgi:hypothetical protein